MFIGSSAFSCTAGELRAETVGGAQFVSGDIDGDGGADFMLRVNGAMVLAAGDFVP